MNILELLKDILVFALKMLYAFFTMVDVSFMGLELMFGIKLYYILGVILAFVIGKKWLRKILLSPVSTFTWAIGLLLEILRSVILKVIPTIWRMVMKLFKTSTNSRSATWWRNTREKAEDIWWRWRY